MNPGVINPQESNLPQDVSRRVVKAIQGALAEEKRPRSERLVKVGLATVVSTLILTLPIAFLFREQLGWVWKAAGAMWALCFWVGFSLYFHPQPRLIVPGYWSPFIFAKILIGMTLLTGIQILLCPSFVFLGSSAGWNPFLNITEWFMAQGGMSACMFACGFIFSSLGGVITFMTVRKILFRSAPRDFIKAVGLAFLTQVPLVGVQIADEGLRPFAVFWGLGSGLGLFVMVSLIKGLLRNN